MAPPRAGTRVAIAQEKLREHLRDHPEMNLSRAMRWLNNERVGGQRLTLRYEEGQAVFNEVRRAPPGQKILPTVVKPRDVRDPLKVPFMEVAHLPPPQPPPSPAVAPPSPPHLRTPGELRAIKLKVAEDLALEDPARNAKTIADALVARFGSSVTASEIQSRLELARSAAGMPINFRRPDLKPGEKEHRRSPINRASPRKEPMPDLVKPAPTDDPNDLLKGAGLKLKHLCGVMKWAKVVLTVDANGQLSYESTPAPVMPTKGTIAL